MTLCMLTVTDDSSSDDRNGHHRDNDLISEDHHVDHYHTGGMTGSHQSMMTARPHRRTALEHTLAVSIFHLLLCLKGN